MFSRLLSLLVSATLVAPAAEAQFVPQTCRNNYTQGEEIALGQKVVAEVYKTQPVLPDSDPVAQYVRQLGARLLSAAPDTPGLERQWPFQFHVVASEEINAFALPGGTMFVNLGAVQAAQTEAQLAGVMSHEMSHVILRHSTCNLKKQQQRGILYGLGQIASQVIIGGDVGELGAAGIGAARNLSFLSMSRGDEQQADLLGVHILNDAGFDPRGLSQFFEIIIAKYGRGSAQFLSDHPNPGNRQEYLTREIALLTPPNRPVVTSPAFATAHERAMREHALSAAEMQAGAWRGTGLYASAPGGVATASAAPVSSPPAPAAAAPAAPALPASALGLADKTRLLQTSRFAVRYPASWQANTAQNGTVSLSPPGGSGAFGISYGVLLGVEPQNGSGIADAASLGAATSRLLSRFQQGYGVSSAGSQQAFRLAGQPALSTDLRGVSPVGSGATRIPELDRVVTVARPDGDLDYLVFVAPERDAPALKPIWDAMLSSFRPQ